MTAGGSVRRPDYTLAVRLHDLLRDRDEDCHACVRIATELLAGQVGDYASVTVLDPPGGGPPAFAVRHRDPERDRLLQHTGGQATPAQLRRLAEAVSGGADVRVHVLTQQRRPRAERDSFVPEAEGYLDAFGLADALLAPLLGPDGTVLGVVTCGRDGGSPQYDDSDLETVAVATEQLRGLLETARARAAERVARQRWELVAAQRKTLVAELMAAEEAERRRVARDIIDRTGPLLEEAIDGLAGLGDQLGQAAHGLGLEAVEDLLVSARSRIEDLAAQLEPAGTDVAAALRLAAEHLFAGTGTACRVRGSLDGVPAAAAEVLHRAAREALANARRHAHAREVTVTLTSVADGWTVAVADDGVGLDGETPPVRPGHYGGRAMRSRLAAVGGSCRWRRPAEGGTEVLLRVPRTAVEAGGAR